MTNQVDERGCFTLQKHTLVRFRFEGVVASELADFNHQNVLFALEFDLEEIEGEPAIRVTFNPSYGLNGTIVCRRAAVVQVSPCDEDAIAITEV